MYRQQQGKRHQSRQHCTHQHLHQFKVNNHKSMLLFYLILYIIQGCAYTVHSYNVYNYDLATPMFTPDGLLKQVEYASSAPSHCTPIVIVPVIILHGGNSESESQSENESESGNKNELSSPQCVIIMASLSPSATGSTGITSGQINDDQEEEEEYNEHDDDNQNENKQNLQNYKNNNNRGQSRIIQIPISPSTLSTSDSGSSSSSSLLIAINGLLPDCISLLRHARNQLHSNHKTYGVHRLHTSVDGTSISSSTSTSASPFASAPSCAYRFASSIAERCQRHSFGGGIRPFGSQIVVCGIDQYDDSMSVYITNPSGALDHYSYYVDQFLSQRKMIQKKTIMINGEKVTVPVVKSDVKGAFVQDVIVLGGDTNVQNEIRQQILSQSGYYDDGVDDDNDGVKDVKKMKDIIPMIVNALKGARSKSESSSGGGGGNANSSLRPLTATTSLDLNNVDVVVLGSRNCQSIDMEQLTRIMKD